MESNHTLEMVDFTPEKPHQAACLQFTADGILVQVDGEFYRDKAGLYHHTHVFKDGVEMELVWEQQ